MWAKGPVDSMDKYKKLTLLPWLMWFIAALFYCYEFLLRVMPSAMMPYLSSFYRVDINGLSFILSAFSLLPIRYSLP